MKWYQKKFDELTEKINGLEYEKEKLSKRIAELESTMEPKRFRVTFEKKTETGSQTTVQDIVADSFTFEYTSHGLFVPMQKAIKFTLKGNPVGMLFTDPISIIEVPLTKDDSRD